MRPRLIFAAAALLSAATSLTVWPTAPASATLAQGARAPDFTAPAAQGGRRFNVNLQALLRRGPVVIYFFPRAFTAGCTLESHAFAEATPQFRAAGATVIGMSGDDVETLARFSTEACRSRFAMASANAAIINGYDVRLGSSAATTRTSYVIAQDGTVALVHNDMNPNDHVRLTLAEVQRLRAARRTARRR